MLTFSGLNSAIAAQKNILIIGDSLSAGYGLKKGQGWVDLLRSRLLKEGYPYTIVNDSISGDTSSNGLARLKAALAKSQPEVVILELGGNDGLRGIHPQQMQNNLSQAVKLSLDAGAKVLLLGVRLPPNYGPVFIQKFLNSYRSIAKAYPIAFVPYFLKGVAENASLMQADGIHPNAKGQAPMLDNVWPKLKGLLRK